MAFKPTDTVGARACVDPAADHDDAKSRRSNRTRRRSCTASLDAPSLDAPGICSRQRRRRVQAPAAPVVDQREAATIAYIRAHADDKLLLVSSKRPHIHVRADAMRSLTVPLSQDGPERKISGVVLDASIELLRRRRQGAVDVGRGRVLLLGVEEQDWLEHLSDLTAEDLTEQQDGADMAATAHQYLQHDMVFFLVNHREHFFVAVLNLRKGEYQVLDSGNHEAYYGDRFYGQALSKIRGGVGRCMEEASRADVARWGLRRVAGLPDQTDDSSCGLFALKWMELWDGDELTQGFSMDDVHALRTTLAKELVFSELNEMSDVKHEIESKIVVFSAGANAHAGSCNATYSVGT